MRKQALGYAAKKGKKLFKKVKGRGKKLFKKGKQLFKKVKGKFKGRRRRGWSRGVRTRHRRKRFELGEASHSRKGKRKARRALKKQKRHDKRAVKKKFRGDKRT